MLPATVMCGHSAYDWNIIAVSRFSGGSRVMSSPPTRIAPSSGITKPAIERSSVVLPQPGAAEQRDHLAALDGEAHAVEHARAAIGHGQVSIDR